MQKHWHVTLLALAEPSFRPPTTIFVSRRNKVQIGSESTRVCIIVVVCLYIAPLLCCYNQHQSFTSHVDVCGVVIGVIHHTILSPRVDI